MRKVLFIGAPGSGKSLLANQVFTELKTRHYNAEIVHEWVRFDIQANGSMESIYEQYLGGHYPCVVFREGVMYLLENIYGKGNPFQRWLTDHRNFDERPVGKRFNGLKSKIQALKTGK